MRKTREEKKSEVRERLKNDLYGEGVFVYANNTSGDLKLPKPANNGKLWVAKGKTFEGDSYFMTLVKTHMLRLIKIIKEEDDMVTESTEEKLLLDQPARFTTEGMTEQVKKKKFPTKLNEGVEKSNKVLINENPVGDIEIIRD